MSKFKVGDKVETPFGVGIFHSYVDGGFMKGSFRVRYKKIHIRRMKGGEEVNE